ncbi:MAG TPA: YihY/virulence factor BrkB family protein [Chloroflexota bacterium]|nr:YihY/virulence factor BrkB family protein [Chloroflexota bacterium]
MGMIKRAKAFWTKFGNDWCMNLAGLLAYNFLTAIFPLLLGILALAALLAPASLIQQLAGKMNTVLPASLTSGANINFYTILQGFRKASGITAVISLVGLLWTGSNLFGVMENCFSIVFRTKTRGFIQQKVMSVAMIVIFAILAPLAVLASSISGSVSSLTHAFGNIPGLGLVFAIGGYAVGVLLAFVLFFCIYLIVPNMAVNPRDVWRGALFAAVLFEIVNLIFPLYVRTQHSQFGQFALLLALLTFWFWVLSLVLLLGAEMNSFAALGQRAAGGDLPTMLHDIQVHGRAPREGEDADAPPAGHPVSASGERIHARDRGEQAPTGEDAAHVPGDADRRSQPGAAAQEQRSASVANVAATEHDQRRSPRVTPSGSRSGQGLLALLATLLAVLSAVHRRDQPRVL